MKLKMNKIFTLMLALVVSVTCCMGLTACKDKHTHSYAGEWSNDATHHWHACTGKDCKVVADKAEHTPGSPATPTKPQVCTECGYVIVPALGDTPAQDNIIDGSELEGLL